jgi:hypothetical protein
MKKRKMECGTMIRRPSLIALVAATVILAGQAFAVDSIKGQVRCGDAPIAQSTVTLFAATEGAPKQLAQTKTDNEGRFEIRTAGASADASLYLVASGGEPKARGAAIILLSGCWRWWAATLRRALSSTR